MLKEFLAWWAEQIIGLVPRPVWAWASQRSSALVVTVVTTSGTNAMSVDVSLRRNKRERPLGHCALAPDAGRLLRDRLERIKQPATVVLRLASSWLLEREVTLPTAAEGDPARVLAYEFDRLTPFTADEVFWGWGILRRDREQGRLHLRLSMVPRAGLRPVLAMLDAAGVTPRLLEVETAEGVARAIPLDRPQGARTRLGRAAPALAVIACAALALTAVVLPFVRQALDRADVEDRIEMLRPRVAEAEVLRQRIAGNLAGSDVIAAERARLGDPLRVIAAVTDILPDDTFLTELQLRRGRLSLAGQSAAAARLIPALAAEPTFRNPAFVAPVTRAERGQADVFSIALDLGPEH